MLLIMRILVGGSSLAMGTDDPLESEVTALARVIWSTTPPPPNCTSLSAELTGNCVRGFDDDLRTCPLQNSLNRHWLEVEDGLRQRFKTMLYIPT